jgi:uncharacterized membrane protein
MGGDEQKPKGGGGSLAVLNGGTGALVRDPAALALGAPRIGAVDVARGSALVAMAVYHFAWDLSFLQLIATPVGTDPAWTWFARSIAGSFLFLVGMSLVLGHGGGVRWRPFLKRLAMVAAAAAAITIATYFAFPQTYIFFGILHCIAVSSVLALPFLRLPWWMTATVAGAVLAAPHFFLSGVFNAPALLWVGLGTRVPLTNDYVPIFPWFGMVLLGIAATRLAMPVLREGRIALWRAGGPVARALSWAGRHSLIIYLIHQPLLLATLYPVARIVGPSPAAEAAPFMRECEQTCASAGRAPAMCRRTCSCTVEELKANGLWKRVVRDALTTEEQQVAGALARKCFGA